MTESVLVTGATGQQGGSVARALLAPGAGVQALVRDADAPQARALARSGPSWSGAISMTSTR